ncbi:MAG: response regulator transcription factor [Alphaproteobacteria bacterium]|nr:response regulator transcription factor [Alphaproteobacteria bacterium]
MAQPQSSALKPHLLVVDDDDRLRTLLRRYLTEQGMIVSTASSAVEARAMLQSLSYDLMVLDVMMPGESGLELTKSLRQAVRPSGRNLPILLLTARGESEDRIAGFEVGADDYLGKPFEPRELLLRINAVLRRSQKAVATETRLKLGKWIYDAQRDELCCGEEKVRLTDMEAGLMRILAADPGSVVSREVLAESGKGMINDRTIDVQVTRLRRKIEDDPKNPRYLITVRGEGYMLLPEPA